jgi:hypothetical protein
MQLGRRNIDGGIKECNIRCPGSSHDPMSLHADFRKRLAVSPKNFINGFFRCFVSISILSVVIDNAIHEHFLSIWTEVHVQRFLGTDFGLLCRSRYHYGYPCVGIDIKIL